MNDIAKLIHPGAAAAATATGLYTRWRGEMAQSKIADILMEAKACLGKEGIDTKSLESKISYLENQQTRMDYAAYRAAGLFIQTSLFYLESGDSASRFKSLFFPGFHWPAFLITKVF